MDALVFLDPSQKQASFKTIHNVTGMILVTELSNSKAQPLRKPKS
jgi:hypothetical protein